MKRKYLASTVVSLVFLAACAVETAPLGPAVLPGAPTLPLAADASVGSNGGGGATTETPDDDGGTGGGGNDASTNASDARADARPVDAGPDVLQPPTPCDRDGDGRLATSCGGDDCCDSDPRVHKGTSGWFDTPTACGNWDYDCDGKAVRETAVIDCKWEFLDWCAGEGFTVDTDCGQTGSFADCQLQGLSCGPVNPVQQRQRCH